jgi:hypothetical protein
MIFRGSRYEALAGAPIVVRSADGRQHAALAIRFIPPTPASYRHTVVAGDRLDLPAETLHAALVGDNGVTCFEAHLPAGSLAPEPVTTPGWAMKSNPSAAA